MKGQSQSRKQMLNATDLSSSSVRGLREHHFQPDLRFNIDSPYAPQPFFPASSYSATPQALQHSYTSQKQGLSQPRNHIHNRHTMLHFPGAEDRAIVMGSGSGSHWTGSDILKGIPHRSGSGVGDINYQGMLERNNYEVPMNRIDPMSLGWSDRYPLPSSISLSHTRFPSTDGSQLPADSYKTEAPASRDIKNISSFMSFQSPSSNGFVGGDGFSVQSSHPSQYHARIFSLDLKDSFK